MVIPIQTGQFVQDGTTPLVIKEKHIYFWVALLVLFLVSAVVQFVVGGVEIGSAMQSGIMAYFIYWMIQDGCAKMTQQCLLLVGMCCFMNFVLEGLRLGGVASGRRDERIHRIDAQSGNLKGVDTETFTVTIQTRPLFDNSMGALYNLQSAMYIASPVMYFLATWMSHVSYNAYPNSLFQEEVDPLNSPTGANAAWGYNSYNAQGGVPVAYQGSGHVLGAGVPVPVVRTPSAAGMAAIQRNSLQRGFEGAGPGQRL